MTRNVDVVVGILSPNTTEPVFNSATQTMLFQDNFDRYASIAQMQANQSDGSPYTNVTGTWSLITGRSGSGQAIRASIPSLTQGQQYSIHADTPSGFYAGGGTGYVWTNMANSAGTLTPPYTNPRQVLYTQIWFRLSAGALFESCKGMEILDSGGGTRTEMGWSNLFTTQPVGGELPLSVNDDYGGLGQGFSSGCPGGFSGSPVVLGQLQGVNDGNWHRWTISIIANTTWGGGACEPGGVASSRDGFIRAWIDGSPVVDYALAAVGVTPPGGAAAWCQDADVDAIGPLIRVANQWPWVIFGGPGAGGSSAFTWDFDDYAVWCDNAAS